MLIHMSYFLTKALTFQVDKKIYIYLRKEKVKLQIIRYLKGGVINQ